MMRTTHVLLLTALAFVSACSTGSSTAALSDQLPASETSGDALRPVEVSSPSLQGTDPDGAVGFGADGTVRVDRALRRRFDYLLSTLGEATLAQVRASLKADLKPVASASSAASALALFDAYTAYLQAVDQLRPLANMDRLQVLHDLRVRALTAPVAQAFFEDEERVDAWALGSRATLSRTELSAQQRTDAQLALAAGLSADARSTLDELVEIKRITDETAAFDASGASAQQRRVAREARLGTTAAQRLAELDAAHARWSARVAAFRVERDALEADATLDAAGRRRALETILSRDFSLPEGRRVRALELAAP